MIAFDAKAAPLSGTGSSGSSQALSTMVVGSDANRALIVKLTGNSPSGYLAPVSSVMWGSQAMTLIAAFNYTAAPFGGGAYRVELWGLINPTSGAQGLTVNYSGPWTYWSIGAVSFTGVDQTGGATTFYGAASAGGTASPSSLHVATSSGDAAVDVIATPGQTPSGPSQTQEYALPAYGAGSYSLAASPTFSWSISYPGFWAGAAVGLKAYTTPPPPPPPPPPPGTGRTYLGGPVTYHVSSSGNDANAGSAAAPWATLTHAYNWCRDNLDMAGQTVTIQLDSNIVESVVCRGPMTGQASSEDFSFVGNPAAPGSVSITTTGSIVFWGYEEARFGVDGMTISSPGFGIVCSAGVIAPANIYWNSCAASCLDVGGSRSYIYAKGPMTWLHAQSFTSAATAEDHGTIALPEPLIISGSPSFGGAFLQADLGGMIDYTAASISPGAATGKQFNALSFGLVFSGNPPGTPCALPGNAPGTVSGGFFQ